MYIPWSQLSGADHLFFAVNENGKIRRSLRYALAASDLSVTIVLPISHGHGLVDVDSSVSGVK